MHPLDLSISISETSSYLSGLSSIFESSESSFIGDSSISSLTPSLVLFLICVTWS